MLDPREAKRERLRRQAEQDEIRRQARAPSGLGELLDRARREFSGESDADKLREVSKRTVSDLVRTFGQRLDQITRTARGFVWDGVRRLMTPPILRKATGLPVDRTGNVLPQPDRPRKVFDGRNPSDRELLRIVGPQVAVVGPTLLHKRNNVIDDVVGEPLDKPSLRTITADSDQKISAPWRQKIRGLRTIFRDLVNRVIDAIRGDKGVRELQREVSKETERVKDLIDQELEHEGRRVLGTQRDDIMSMIDEDVLIGFVLHSVFLETTGKDHAARDGWTFYRDDRRGSSLPWSNRLVPPYRKNCKCFTIEIFQDPEGDEFYANWDAFPRVSGSRRMRRDDIGGWFFDGKVMRRVGPMDVGKTFGRADAVAIQPRDVGSYQEWFNVQRQSIQMRIMGQLRVMAALAQKTEDSRLVYSDFVGTDGSILGPQKLAAETDRQRQVRQSVVKQIIERTSKSHQKAWRESGNRWKLRPHEREAYDKRLATVPI